MYLRVPLIRLAVDTATPDWDEDCLSMSAIIWPMDVFSESALVALSNCPRPLIVACHMSSMAVGVLPVGDGQLIVGTVNAARVAGVCGKVPLKPRPMA